MYTFDPNRLFWTIAHIDGHINNMVSLYVKCVQFFHILVLPLLATLLAQVRSMRLAFRLHAVFSSALVSSAV